MSGTALDPDSYGALLAQAKAAVRDAQLELNLTVNRELIGLYWQLGRLILTPSRPRAEEPRSHRAFLGGLRAEFPDMKGLSRSNLHYM